MAERVRPTRRELEAIIADRFSAQKGRLAGAGFPSVKVFDKQKGGGHARGLKCWPNSPRPTPIFVRGCILALPMDGCWMSASILDTIQVR